MKIKFVKWDSFEPHVLKFAKKNKKSKYETATEFSAMDTETSKLFMDTIKEWRGWIYQWCFSYPMDEGVQLVYGRKPSQLVCCLDKIKTVNNLNEYRNFVVYIHNASYDYTYIKDWLKQHFQEQGDIIAVDTHKIISFQIAGFIFKCSYRLSQKSLEAWGKANNIKHGKLVGEIDYDVVRFQDSPLTRRDWRYMFRDVLALYECVTEEMRINKDSILTIPLTNTGYVRRHTRERFKKDKNNRKIFEQNRMDDKVYKLLESENAGGLTHGNRFLQGETVEITEEDLKNGKCIRHRDFVSHYPSQQRTQDAPVSKFIPLYNVFESEKYGLRKWTVDDLVELDKTKEYLAILKIKEARVHDGVTLPYLQSNKCIEGSAKSKRKYIKTSMDFEKLIEDNGRVLYLKGECYITVNKHDLKWILKQYDADMEVIVVYSSERGPFPQYLRDTVDFFFYEKTRTKNIMKKLEREGVPKIDQRYIEAATNNRIAKAMLNAIFGMSDTNPVRLNYWEDENGEWHKEKLTDEAVKEKLDKFYESRNSFMELKFGAWTTSHARNELMDFVELIGYENFLYADTDSIFYISTPEIEERIEARNKELREEGDAKGWYCDIDEKKVYFRQFDLEDEVIVKFRFLHAKCYAYVLDNGKLNVTIAGVSAYSKDKKTTREQELVDIENLKDGFEFLKCGGTSCEYIFHVPVEAEINGHMTQYASAAIITPTTKTLKELREDPFEFSRADI